MKTQTTKRVSAIVENVVIDGNNITPEDFRCLVDIQEQFKRAQELFSYLSPGAQQFLHDLHNENTQVGNLVRWGEQNCGEARDAIFAAGNHPSTKNEVATEDRFRAPRKDDPHHRFYDRILCGGRVWRDDQLNGVKEWLSQESLGDINKIVGFGYSDLYDPQDMGDLLRLWEQVGDIPVIDEYGFEVIGEPFLHFPSGTPRECIWRWFEAQNPAFLVGEVMHEKDGASPSP